MHHLAAAGRMSHMDRIFQIQMLGQRRQVVCVVVHVVTAIDLGGPSVPPPVMGNDPVALAEKEHHLRIPVVRGERPAMAEDDGLSLAPVLVEDLDPVLGGDRGHQASSLCEISTPAPRGGCSRNGVRKSNGEAIEAIQDAPLLQYCAATGDGGSEIAQIGRTTPGRPMAHSSDDLSHSAPSAAASYVACRNWSSAPSGSDAWLTAS